MRRIKIADHLFQHGQPLLAALFSFLLAVRMLQSAMFFQFRIKGAKSAGSEIQFVQIFLEPLLGVAFPAFGQKRFFILSVCGFYFFTAASS